MDEIKPIHIEMYALGKLEELIAKFNRRAMKLGVKPIEFTVATKTTRRIRKTYADMQVVFVGKADTSDDTMFEDYTYLEVTFAGDPLKVDGWEFIGTIQHTETVNILRSVPGREIPESFRTVQAHCQHCDKSRARRDTMVLQKESEYKQVGRNCLRDFLGHDPMMQLKLLDALYEISSGEDDEFGSGRWPRSVPPEYLLDMTAAVALKLGFAKGVPYTAWGYIFPDADHCKMVREGKIPDIRVTPEAVALAARALEWLETAQSNGFIENVKAVCSLKSVTGRECNLCGWAIGAYLKEIERDKMRQVQVDERRKGLEALKGSVHFGEIKKRMHMTLKVIATRKIPVEGGDSLTLYKFITPEGNVVTWLTSTDGYFPEGYFLVKATVKGFREYEGIKETSVNRVSLEISEKGEKDAVCSFQQTKP